MKNPLSATITRPANTTAYTAGDVIGTESSHILTFANAPEENGGYGADVIGIVKAWLIDSAQPTTVVQAELWLFTVAPAAQADNAAFAVTDAELMAGFVGIIPFSTSYVGLASGNCVFEGAGSNLTVKLTDGESNLYGVLVVRNAYVPVSGEQFKVRLDTV